MQNVFLHLNIPFALLVFSSIPINGEAQNLVANPGFETIIACPETYGLICNYYAPPWECGNDGSPDLFNVCPLNGIVGIPSNLEGYQYAHTGEGYAGFLAKWIQVNRREYLLIPLSEPLIAGTWYDLTYYLSLAEDSGCGVEQIGAYFSATSPYVDTWDPLDVTPQIETNYGYLDDMLNWTLIHGCFQAEGGEVFLTIGNFHSDAETPLDPDCSGSFSYYYIDDVSLVVGEAPGSLYLDLEGPIIACFSYEIDPQSDGPYFIWSDGSNDPTLVVTTSGEYDLTITDGCNQIDDSIYVTIIQPVPPVDLGPETLSLCSGDSYVITLDLSLGEFEWNDGSTEGVYTISNPGVYSVTANDGCTISTDDITVTGLDPPLPFTLGDDVSLCDGEELTYTFDPLLGDFSWQDGSTSTTYTITEEGSYALTISNECGEQSDLMVFTVLGPPEFDLGPDDQILCLGEIINYDLDPGLGDFLWQDGSTLSSYTVTESGAYSLTVTNECGSLSNEVIVIDQDIPELELGDDDQVLCVGTIIEIEIDPALGDIQWQDGSTSSIYEISGAGLYTVFVSNTCGVASDLINVTLLDTPVFDLGPDIQLCTNDSLTLDGGGIQGNYTWQDNSSSSSFLVTSPGTYALTISNVCSAGVDTIIVDYSTPLLPPELGPDFTLCPGESFVLHASSPGASFLWQDGSVLDSFIVSSAGTFYVQAVDACSSFSDTILVAINNNPPQIDLPSQLTLCQGQSVTLDALIGGVNYLWNDNSLNQQLTVTAPGTYSLTVTNTCGTDIDTTIILDGGLAPAVELGNDINLCPGESIVISPVYANVDSWIWNDGSSLDSFVVSGVTQVFVEVNNSCGAAFDTLNTSLLPATPPLDLGTDTSLCSGESFVLSINTPAVYILWPDGSTASTFSVIGPGLIFASISNSCGQSFDTIQVDALPDIPTLNLGVDQSLCPGEIISLSPGITNVLYEWQDGSTGNTYQSTQEETVILNISNDCGTTSDTLEIFESTDGPQADLGQDILACEGEIITVPAGISGVDFLWQDGSTGDDFVTAVSSTLILQVSNLCGTDTDTINVDIHGLPPVVQLGPDTSLCEGISLLLTSIADAETTITWQDGSSQASYNVTSPGTFILTESNRCGNDVDSVVVAYIDAPNDFTLGRDTTLCPGESIILNAPLTSFEIEWQDGTTQSTIIADQPITYSLQISNECGTQSDSLSVSIDNRTPVVDIDPSIEWCQGDIITLDATQSFTATYQWSSGETTPVIQVTSPGAFSIDISTPCSALSQSVDIIPGTDCFVAEIHDDIYIPNVFSPNDDNINDVFTVTYGADLDVIGMEGSIFDRWGNLVFQSSDNPFSWDGRFAGEIVKPGVFVFVVKVIYVADPAGKQELVFSGDITLLR